MKRRMLLGAAAIGAMGINPGITFAQGMVIRLGQSASLTGGQARYGTDVRDGLLAALAYGNRQGKAKGLSFELSTLDDGGAKNRVQENVRSLINDGVLAVIGLTSGAGAEAVLDAVNAADIPLIGVASGNMGIRGSQRNLFHVRAGYDQEYRRMLAYLRTYGLQRVAYVYLQDTSKANAQAMADAMASEKINPAVLVGIDRNAKSFDEAVAKVLAAKPDCVLYTTNAGPLLSMAKQLAAAGFRGLTLSSSFAGQELVENVPSLGQTVILSTVVPRPVRMQYSVVKDCVADLQAAGSKTQIGLTVLEGYIAGRVAVAAALGASKAGAPTRTQLRDALAGLRLDLGGYLVDYTGGRHGSDFVDVISVDRQGRMIG